MKLNFKSEKGITMVAIVITIVILFIIVSAVSFSSKNGIDMKNINNMYTDIMLLEDKVAMYYLANSALPVISTPLNIDEVPDKIKTFNPNDNDVYYKIDLSLLDNITLNNAKDRSNVTDTYIINQRSHSIYYLKGVSVDEYTSKTLVKTGKNVYYTIPREFKYVDLTRLETDIIGVDADYSSSDDFIFSASDPSVIIGLDPSKLTGGKNYNGNLVIPFERVYIDENGVTQTIRITKIEAGAFDYDSKNVQIKGNVHIPNRIVVEEGAFKGQANIGEVIINASVLGESAFEDCSGIKALTVTGVKVIPKNAFKNALNSSADKIIIGNTVEVIEEYAFAEAAAVFEIEFPTTLKKIGDYAFANPRSNSGVESIDLSLCFDLTEIGDSAFYGNRKIKEVKLPLNKSISIGKKAFNNSYSSGNYTVEMYGSTYWTNTFPTGVTILNGNRND